MSHGCCDSIAGFDYPMIPHMLTIVSLLTALLQGYNLWTMRTGKVPHLRLAFTYTGYAIVETWLALRDVTQIGMLSFVVLDIWCVGISLVGWRMCNAKANEGAKDQDS